MENEQATQEVGVLNNAFLINSQLTFKEIDDKIRELILNLYGCCYLHNIKIERLRPIGYKISMPLNNYERPYTFIIEADGDNFYKYLKLVILESALSRADYFTATINDHSYDIIKPQKEKTFRTNSLGHIFITGELNGLSLHLHNIVNERNNLSNE